MKLKAVVPSCPSPFILSEVFFFFISIIFLPGVSCVPIGQRPKRDLIGLRGIVESPGHVRLWSKKKEGG